MNWPTRLRLVFTVIAGAAIVVCAYWNVASTYVAADQLRPRENDDLVRWEQRFQPIRLNLLSAGYRGEIGFITKRDLREQAWTFDDMVRWQLTQYQMLPWMVVHGKKDAPFVIADFWDGSPDMPIQGFAPFYDAGNGLIVLRSKR